MKHKFLWIFPAIILILSGAAQAWAVNSYVSDIPNGSKFSCNTCHVNINVDNKRNDFGLAFKNNNHTWNASLASLDSDGDGYTNGTELQDPNGTWVTGQPSPGNLSLVSNPSDAGSVPPAQTYSISGTVSGAIQAGVTMTLTGSSSGSTTTGASGNYSFTGLSNGSYTITPSKTGYTITPTSIAVTISGANQTGKNFTATAVTYSISGTVSGAVQAGVTITLSGAASRTTTTDASGNYSFPGLSSGTYTVTPDKSGNTFTPASVQVVITNASVSGINFTASGAGACDNWSDVIDKYNDYVEGQAVWSEVIDCYNEYVAVHP